MTIEFDIDNFRKEVNKILDEKGRGAKSALARKIGVSPQAIYQILSGKFIGDEKNRRAICYELDLDYEEVHGLKKYRSRPEPTYEYHSNPAVEQILQDEDIDGLAYVLKVLDARFFEGRFDQSIPDEGKMNLLKGLKYVLKNQVDKEREK